MDTKSALLRLWEMGAAEHGRLARAIFHSLCRCALWNAAVYRCGADHHWSAPW